MPKWTDYFFYIRAIVNIGYQYEFKWDLFSFHQMQSHFNCSFLFFFFSLLTAEVQVTKEEHHKVQMDLDACLTELGDLQKTALFILCFCLRKMQIYLLLFTTPLSSTVAGFQVGLQCVLSTVLKIEVQSSTLNVALQTLSCM